MLEEAIDLGEEDLVERLLVKARTDAEQILAALKKQMTEYPELLDPEEKEAIDAKTRELEQARGGDDRELIGKLVEELNEITTPLAHRIMDSAIKRALERKSVDEISAGGGGHNQ